ncbi:DNA oxidative demethylase ALKBH2 [Callorhinchus milii]|uniref:DNA oxidative demethylase ALKBH2 n=1 Tax=Callorhinchus milii TaxID=7868 RepID=UPI001C3FB71F|nr:DNA oxidative demethylase ALKBH2 [Callorhinchus milii]
MDKFAIKKRKVPGKPGELRERRGGRRRRTGTPPPLTLLSTDVRPVWRHVAAEGLDCDYAVIFTRSEADDIFLRLEEELEYFSGDLSRVQVYGKWYQIPRKQVAHGDPRLTYKYSGVTLSPKPWLPVLERIRERVRETTGHVFNFVLINRYQDGKDHIGEHRDDERELEQGSPIASVSFGASRDFVFRHGSARGGGSRRRQGRLEPIKLLLEHGGLLLMNHPTNVHWYHSLPVRKRVLAPRVNLTFARSCVSARIDRDGRPPLQSFPPPARTKSLHSGQR